MSKAARRSVSCAFEDRVEVREGAGSGDVAVEASRTDDVLRLLQVLDAIALERACRGSILR